MPSSRIRTSRAKITPLRGVVAGQQGIAVVLAMVFVLVFLTLGGALYTLLYSQMHSTDTERVEIKSFNVAEAGIDAGMLTLKLNWPRRSTDDATAAVSGTALKTALQTANPGLYDPTFSSSSEFLQVAIYDNVDTATGLATTVPDPDAPTWDSNADGKMFVDAVANVSDDRRRILIMAERQAWQLAFPTGLALWSGTVASNGQGFEVTIETGTPPVYYDVHDALHKGVKPNPPTDVLAATPTEWENVISTQTQMALMRIAQDQHTYFEGSGAAAAATACLVSGEGNGKVVYVKSDTSVNIAGETQVGTVEEPVVLIFDTPDGVDNAWDFKGTADFYGIMITVGNNELRGTSAMHGAVYCKGTMTNKGTGNIAELLYNQDVINNINRQYVIDVNIVPNTWEEYALPAS